VYILIDFSLVKHKFRVEQETKMQKDPDSLMIPESNNENTLNSQDEIIHTQLQLPQPNIISQIPNSPPHKSSVLKEPTHNTNIEANLSQNSNYNSEEKSQEDCHRSTGGKGSNIKAEESKNNIFIIKGENTESKILMPIPKKTAIEERKSNIKRESVKNWRCRTSAEYIFDS